MTTNKHILRLLGESDDILGEQPQNDPAQEAPEQSPSSKDSVRSLVPKNQEIIQLWNSGDHRGVAETLLFSSASYADFVDLVFTLGQAQAQELGKLLDQVTEENSVESPPTPPQYTDKLRKIVSNGTEEVI